MWARYVPAVALAGGLIAPSAFAQELANPSWAAMPDGEAMAEAYPVFAYMAELDGDVILQCGIAADSTLSLCRAVEARPAGLGFDRAGLSVASLFRANPARVDGETVPSQVRFAVRFRMPALEWAPPWTGPEPTPEHLAAAREKGKGVLLLAGHFGNWEVSTVAGMSQFKQYRGLLHFIRRPLNPKWFNDLVMRRFRKAGFGTLEKSGSLDEILALLEDNRIVVSIFDQFTVKKYGIPSEFFGHPAHTFKSLAVLAQFTGAPVIPSSSWREADGTHVLLFEPPVEVITEGRTKDIIAKNTKRFNEALERIILRHPEQWIWMHKRWKEVREER